jgi:hypothetical protein
MVFLVEWPLTCFLIPFYLELLQRKEYFHVKRHYQHPYHVRINKSWNVPALKLSDLTQLSAQSEWKGWGRMERYSEYNETENEGTGFDLSL